LPKKLSSHIPGSSKTGADMSETGKERGSLFNLEIRFGENGKCQFVRMRIGGSAVALIALLVQIAIGWKAIPFKSIIKTLHLPW
jgi:hypothetical protein